MNLDATIARRQGISERFMNSIYAFRHQIGDQFGIVDFKGETYAVKLAYDFDALAGDPKFVNALSQIDFFSHFRQDLNKETLAEIRDFRDDLGERLGYEKAAAQ